MPVRPLTVAALLLSAACASASTSARPAVQAGNVIPERELSTHATGSAFDAVRMLRPNFFVTRGPTSIVFAGSDRPVVYLDGVPFGELEALRGIQTANVHEIRFINGRDATLRWGTNHGAGVIYVVTKQR
jgi:hypothetical protein